MGTLRIAVFSLLTVGVGSTVWAQYGLYGSPDTLRLPQQETQATYPTTTYPATAPSQPQPATQYYSPSPQYRYPATAAYRTAQPQYRYPVQAQSTTVFQPYQPGAQYQYPGPYAASPYATRPVRTAAADQQPIPAPPGLPTPEGIAPQNQQSVGPNMMNQVMAEQPGCYGCGNGCGVYGDTLGQFEQAACGGCNNPYSCDGSGYFCPWYASASVLVLGRSDGRVLWTSYQTGSEETQLTNTQFGLAWKWGGEATLGRRFCCGCVPYAWEVTYWTTDAFSGSQTTSLYPTGYVSTPLIVRYIEFNGVGADQWFDGARAHRLARNDEIHNFEINLIREQLAWACDSPWDIGWSVGVRYFRFQDMLTFSTVSHDGTGDAYLQDVINNNLVGVQFGFDAAYNIGSSGLRLFITPQVGIYENFLDSTFQAKGRVGSGPYYDGVTTLGNFPARGSKNDVSFLTQIDVGADWQFSRHWGARLGYRVVAITGIGFAEDQFPQYINDIPAIQNVQNYSSLVLHGAFLGVTYNF